MSSWVSVTVLKSKQPNFECTKMKKWISSKIAALFEKKRVPVKPFNPLDVLRSLVKRLFIKMATMRRVLLQSSIVLIGISAIAGMFWDAPWMVQSNTCNRFHAQWMGQDSKKLLQAFGQPDSKLFNNTNRFYFLRFTTKNKKGYFSKLEVLTIG
jgi:hypothetical protein